MENEKELLKEKIRERYKGINPEDCEIIPAFEQPKLYDENSQKRVAAYARVSTIDINQTTSYELQKNHYTDLINKHEGWNLVKIYADEGISGTSLNHRDSFVQMIEDCKQGKIDLIVTKSVSRFARNTLDCLDYIRQLKNLPHPVGILFETENLYTLDSRSEMALSFLATMAQEESHIKSDIMNASLEMRFSRGILLTPALLGYDKDENGNLVVNKEEAITVKLIFFMYLYGNTCKQIAELLTEYGRKTKKGNTKWSANSVLQVLQNERHCGDVLTRKTWTPDYLNHKSKKNRHNLEQRRWKNQHEPIISRANFMAVQQLIKNAKYGNKGFLPELKVIKNGILTGFIIINPRWAGFKVKDYLNVAEKTEITEEKNIKISVKSGDFDLRKFQVARSQFFDKNNIISVTFSPTSITFSTECVRKLKNTQYVELLINPTKKLFGVRSCDVKSSRNAVQWAKIKGNNYYSKVIPGTAFLPNLYELLNWDLDHKYRLRGAVHNKKEETFITFNTTETEIFIARDNERISNFIQSSSIKHFTNGPKKDIMAFPEDWADSFGVNYYRQIQAREIEIMNAENEWRLKEEGISCNEQFGDVTPKEELKENIESLKNIINGGVVDNG